MDWPYHQTQVDWEILTSMGDWCSPRRAWTGCAWENGLDLPDIPAQGPRTLGPSSRPLVHSKRPKPPVGH